MSSKEILKQLKTLGSDSYKRILLNHGVEEPVYGVKVEELKKFQKKIKKDYQLARDLFATGVYDAQYLAGLVADEGKMTKKDLKNWLTNANSSALCGSAVTWVTAESKHGWGLALEWIESKNEVIATTGWETLGCVVALKDDADLELATLKKLLERVEKTIHEAPNRVRYGMNSFLIAVGIYVAPLHDMAVKIAGKIGKVPVDMGNTACKVPHAPEYIQKAAKRGNIGKKRKTVRC
jgi:3-methyladenine DNA glycosylase AlkD